MNASVDGIGDWPIFGMTDDIRPALADAVAQGQPLALATLIDADGGSPRAPGAQMMISPTSLSGFFSGGCVEADVAAHARAALEDLRPRRLVYGQGSPWPDIRLLCGARIEILVEPLRPDDPALAQWLALRAARRAATWLTNGVERTCDASPTTDCVTRVEVTADPFALRLTSPPQKRMVVVGGDPTALAIARLAQDMGFDTHLVRPRGPVAPPPGRLEGYWRMDAARALEAIGLDPWTFVAVATHDTEIDETALLAALPSRATYVGVLGARRRLPERLARLAAQGVSPTDLARLKGPIGLDLGGKAPFEIAVAVMGEVTAHAAGR